MSDAISDIAQSGQMAENANQFYIALIKYLESPSSSSLAQVKEAAQKATSSRAGYWGEVYMFVNKLDERLKSLLEASEEEWANLLYKLSYSRGLYSSAKAISPFTDEIILFISNRGSYLEVRGDLLSLLAEGLHCSEADMDDYRVIHVLTLNELSPDSYRVFTIP